MTGTGSVLWRCSACGWLGLHAVHPADTHCELGKLGVDSWDAIDLAGVLAERNRFRQALETIVFIGETRDVQVAEGALRGSDKA